MRGIFIWGLFCGIDDFFVDLLLFIKASEETRELAFCCIISADHIFPLHPVAQSWKFGTFIGCLLLVLN